MRLRNDYDAESGWCDNRNGPNLLHSPFLSFPIRRHLDRRAFDGACPPTLRVEFNLPGILGFAISSFQCHHDVRANLRMAEKQIDIVILFAQANRYRRLA